MVDQVVVANPRLVLDVATGPGGVAVQLAERTPARVVGIDITAAMLTEARQAADAHGSGDRVQLVQGRGEQLPFADGAFDALTFTYLLRYVADPGATVRELARVVRPGGLVASLEFLVPRSVFWWAWWMAYTRFVLPAAGAVTGGRTWYRVGRFLGPNISAHYRRYPLSWLERVWLEAGFTDVGVRRMSLGGGVVMWGRRTGG